ncbi:hypothetical protein WN944_009391 [Citrus x changshan-huyou]|uniref:Uncharacterized protein n=1 Tax=Citrus x changshan-huyou TaxID=2935761 RepID=A0AAP0MV47_9ROSI
MYSIDHASIDIKLADSLSRKFKTLHDPSSEECCIYRVPQSRRCLYPRDYTPQIVSIGPLHHGNEELKDMENNKIVYLRYFFERTKPSQPRDRSEFNYQNIPGAKELHQAGVKFESRPRSQNLLNIKFNNGILVIPLFTAFGSRTECLYRNLLAFENVHGCPPYFNDYVAIIRDVKYPIMDG